MTHTATSPAQTPPGVFGLSTNHNETLITTRPARGLSSNHNETLITAQPARGLSSNHNETLITARPARGISVNHNETLIVDSLAWPHPELRHPAAVRPAG